MSATRRFEDDRGGSNRVSEKSTRCDHIDDVLAICVRANGPADLYGCTDTEMYKSLPGGRQLGEPN